MTAADRCRSRGYLAGHGRVCRRFSATGVASYRLNESTILVPNFAANAKQNMARSKMGRSPSPRRFSERLLLDKAAEQDRVLNVVVDAPFEADRNRAIEDVKRPMPFDLARIVAQFLAQLIAILMRRVVDDRVRTSYR